MTTRTFFLLTAYVAICGGLFVLVGELVINHSIHDRGMTYMAAGVAFLALSRTFPESE